MPAAQHKTASLSCAICGNNQVCIVAEKDRNAKPLTNVMCVKCGLVWVDPRPANDSIERFYTSEYRKRYKGDFRPKPKHCYRETLRAIDRANHFFSVYKDGMRALDIGAGAGFFAYALKKAGIIIDGIEPDEAYSNFARSNLCLDKIKTMFIQDVSEENHYDIITINHVFEHLPNPRQAMAQMHKLLKKGGRALIEVPNIEATYHAPNKIFHVGHLYWYNPITMQALALQHGFAIDDFKIAAGAKHINMLLSKTDHAPSAAKINEMLTGNAERVWRKMRKHTMIKHFLSPAPYARFVSKMSQYYKERAYINGFNDCKAICDSVCAKWLADSQQPYQPPARKPLT